MFVKQSLSSSKLAWKPNNSPLLQRSPILHRSLHSYALILLFISRPVLANLELPNLAVNDHESQLANAGSEKPDDCESCVLLVKSFEKGLERTERGKHEGGDTSWEEKNLKNYADSEVRLVEIQDDLCNDLTTGKTQCLSMAETGEQHIEDWWFEHRNKNVRLHDYLCITKLKKCCPEGTFGPKCQKCPDCDGHGKCDGSGTRSGSGECNCNQGYRGKLCDECDKDYYSSRFGSEGKFECLKCHKACKGGCLGPTSANCTECAAGYARDPKTNYCNDINECELNPDQLSLDSKRLCKDGTYCENTDGHYKCSPCHHVCQTCLGYGRDKCLTCVSDYHMNENRTCIHFSDETADGSTVIYYLYMVMELMAIVILNHCTMKLTHFLLRVTGFRAFDFFEDLITEMILRLSLTLPIALLVGHMSSQGITKRYMTNLYKSFRYIITGNLSDTAEYAS
uniref:Cysteine-rich with EGF-like domain protein 2 n=1 Tax=Aceria tosichella TaxID=561515 RepID=A0A6G1SAU8_9ACAR